MIGQILLWVLYEIFMSIPQGLAICKRSSLLMFSLYFRIINGWGHWSAAPSTPLLGWGPSSTANKYTLDKCTAFFLSLICLCQRHNLLPTVFTTILTLVLNLVSGKILLKNDLELRIAILRNFWYAKINTFKGALEKSGGEKPEVFNSQLLIGMLRSQTEILKTHCHSSLLKSTSSHLSLLSFTKFLLSFCTFFYLGKKKWSFAQSFS